VLGLLGAVCEAALSLVLAGCSVALLWVCTDYGLWFTGAEAHPQRPWPRSLFNGVPKAAAGGLWWPQA
jgi:hypothetical protein